MFQGNILITGGSGTLGKAIVDYAIRYGRNCTFTIFSRSELRQAEMSAKYPGLRYVIGDIRDESQVRAAVAGHDIVIHAAAMKRLPECEMFPGECMKTNVLGSWNVLQACILGNVRKCVAISTDKACAAITTYGASKRMMEGLLQQQQTTVNCTLVRYGNVIGSNGSVIPLWLKQKSENKPITITGGHMTRFWMSVEQAVELIEDAIPIQRNGCILVPKMQSLGIREMAEIVAPGHEMVDVGLRSREKDHEDLVHPDEPFAEMPTMFVLHPQYTQKGMWYNSKDCNRISPAGFRRMAGLSE